MTKVGSSAFDKLMRPLEETVRAYLAEERAAGATQIALAQVKTVLNRMSGRPGGLAATVARRLVADGSVKHFEPMGTDGIVYLV